MGHPGPIETCASLQVAGARIADLEKKLSVLKLMRIDEWERLARYLDHGSDWSWAIAVPIAAIVELLKDEEKRTP